MRERGREREREREKERQTDRQTERGGRELIEEWRNKLRWGVGGDEKWT